MPHLIGDSQRLQQVLLTLLKLQLKNQNCKNCLVRIFAAYDKALGELRVKVHNNGAGMDVRQAIDFSPLTGDKTRLFKTQANS